MRRIDRVRGFEFSWHSRAIATALDFPLLPALPASRIAVRLIRPVQARFDAEQLRTEGRSSEYVRISDDGEERIFSFCPECGGTVFFKFPTMPDMIAVPVGVFADPDFPVPIRSIYETRRHPWVQLPDGIEHEAL